MVSALPGYRCCPVEGHGWLRVPLVSGSDPLQAMVDFPSSASGDQTCLAGDCTMLWCWLILAGGARFPLPTVPQPCSGRLAGAVLVWPPAVLVPGTEQVWPRTAAWAQRWAVARKVAAAAPGVRQLA